MLGVPPAFVLSQDQTLYLILYIPTRPSRTFLIYSSALALASRCVFLSRFFKSRSDFLLHSRKESLRVFRIVHFSRCRCFEKAVTRSMNTQNIAKIFLSAPIGIFYYIIMILFCQLKLLQYFFFFSVNYAQILCKNGSAGVIIPSGSSYTEGLCFLSRLLKCFCRVFRIGFPSIYLLYVRHHTPT